MQYTKFVGHLILSFKEVKVLKVLPYMGMAVILIMRPGTFEQHFFLAFHGGST